MAFKKYLTLSFCLLLVILLFYGGINQVEQGSKELLGVEEPPQAFRFSLEGGELEIYWAGRRRIFDISFVTRAAASLRQKLPAF
jgi:hypothetical protein